MVDNISKGVKLKTEDSDMAENIPVELIQRGINITEKEEKLSASSIRPGII